MALVVSLVSLLLFCDILVGKFGWQCKFDCHCKIGEDCDNVTCCVKAAVNKDCMA